MANKALFNTVTAAVPKADTVNNAGGKAYKMPPKHMLAQLAATGCLNSTFYVQARDQLKNVTDLCNGDVSPEFIGKVAVYSRRIGFMKDMPALLCAILASKDVKILKKVFPAVIDNAKMMRNFVQIIRSGATGRKSMGSVAKKLVEGWFDRKSDDWLFRDSVGNNPSMADVIKMVHPAPKTDSRRALYGYLIGAEEGKETTYYARYLPELVKQYEAFKKNPSGEVPNVPFQMLTSLNITDEVWKQIAKMAPWQMTRMNLNTFERHNVLKDHKMVEIIADRLRDKEQILKSRVFPYQLMAAYENYNGERKIKLALQDAMELATQNVPAFDGKVVLCIDVSGSMSAPVTGHRKGATTAISCRQVAALLASTVIRRNEDAEVIVFEDSAKYLSLNSRDSIMTNAQIISRQGGGGTNCTSALQKINERVKNPDLVIMVSDNESWVETAMWRQRFYGFGPFTASPNGGTPFMEQWQRIKGRSKKAKLVAIDLTPNNSVQAIDREDILNIGGFSDAVFNVISAFAKGGNDAKHWVEVIEQIDLDKLQKQPKERVEKTEESEDEEED